MYYRLFKLRFRRRLRKGQKQVEDIGLQAEANLEQHLFKRLGSLGKSWRFVATWVGLVALLIVGLVVQLEQLGNQYQSLQPVPGGVFTEGVLGSFTNANPMYATSEADATVSKLIFAGLFTYDNHNNLVGDLARSYDVDAKGTTYTVHLKPNLTWQDGQRLTADDVVFTYRAIQDPDAKSPLASSWQGIAVTKKDNYTVIFRLPNPLSSFPYTLTNGIVPARAFKDMPPSDWRSAEFNTMHPVGSGPFAWSALQVADHNPGTAQVLIALKPFAQYQGGKPKLDGFVVHTFADANQLVAAFQKNSVSSIDGLAAVPQELKDSHKIHQNNLLLTAATMVFFNTSSGPLADTQVRQALVRGTNRTVIISQLGYTTRPVREPLLEGQIGYDRAYVQAPFSPTEARATLAKDGWTTKQNGQLVKDGKPLNISLLASSNGEYHAVVRQLKLQWEALGANVTVNEQNASGFQDALSARNYDAVLYGVSIGVDPDVFVYWHSSQTDARSTRLNLSVYKSSAADAALEAGRTRLDPALRAIKYKPFLQAWQQDAPAVGLYQPRLLYITHSKVYGLAAQFINNDADRLNNVQNWMILTDKVTND